MLPENRLSSEIVIGDFLLPVRKYPNKSTSFGGINFDDTTQGLSSYTWEGVCDGKNIVISNGIHTHTIVSDSPSEIYFFDFSFTQSMNYLVCWETIDGSFFKFFDTSVSSYNTVSIENVTNMCCSLDDTRYVFSGSSDVILSYQRKSDKALCVRMQRDRYTIEYELSEVSQYYLKQVGMMSNNRFGFMFSDSEDYAF